MAETGVNANPAAWRTAGDAQRATADQYLIWSREDPEQVAALSKSLGPIGSQFVQHITDYQTNRRVRGATVAAQHREFGDGLAIGGSAYEASDASAGETARRIVGNL